MEGAVIREGHVIASDDGLFLLVLGRSERGSADQWLCMVLGDFYQGLGSEPHSPGHLDVFSIRVDSAWEVVAP